MEKVFIIKELTQISGIGKSAFFNAKCAKDPQWRDGAIESLCDPCVVLADLAVELELQSCR